MRFTLAALFLLTAYPVLADEPDFDADHILRNGATEPEPLASGNWYSIHGTGLSNGSCTAPQETTPDKYPRELCGVQIVIDGYPAPLNFVSETQVNFFAEEISETPGNVSLRHVLGGQTVIVALPRGPLPVRLSLRDDLRVGLPVWLEVKIPNRPVQFPVTEHPQRWRCHEVEVSRNGEVLAQRALADGIMAISEIGPCGMVGLPGIPTITNRLPLHLLYPFDQAGDYTVHYVLRQDEKPGGPAVVESERVNFHLDAAAPELRSQWLSSLIAPAVAVELVTDYLPSIGGYPDAQTQQLLDRYTEHEVPLVRSIARGLREMR